MLFKNALLASRTTLADKLSKISQTTVSHIEDELPIQALNYIHGLSNPHQMDDKLFVIEINRDSTYLERLNTHEKNELLALDGVFSDSSYALSGMLCERHFLAINRDISALSLGDDNIHFSVRTGKRKFYERLASVKPICAFFKRDDNRGTNLLKKTIKSLSSQDSEQHFHKVFSRVLPQLSPGTDENGLFYFQRVTVEAVKTKGWKPLVYTLNGLCQHIQSLINRTSAVKLKICDIQNLLSQHVGSDWNALCASELDSYKCGGILFMKRWENDKTMAFTPLDGIEMFFSRSESNHEEIYHINWSEITQLAGLRTEILGEGFSEWFMWCAHSAESLLDDMDMKVFYENVHRKLMKDRFNKVV